MGAHEALRVNVAVVTVGRMESLVDTLTDLTRQDYPSYQIIVVDQNSEPLTARLDIVRQSGGKIRVKHLLPPHICVARNVAILSGECDIVVFVDDDIRCGPDFVSSHVEAYGNPQVGGVGGWIDAPAATHVWKPEEEYTWGAIGCNMSYRRSVLLLAGGFDPHFKAIPAVGEERELTNRVRRLGYRIAVARRALAYHRVMPSGGCRPRHDVQQYWSNAASCHVLRFLKTRSLGHRLLLLPWLLKLWWTLSRLSKGSLGMRAFFQGVREGVAMTRKSLQQRDYLSLTPALHWQN